MDEISEDGFWQSVDGEWVPTEKQLTALQNGAIAHDAETAEQVTEISVHTEYDSSRLVLQPSSSQPSGTEDYVELVGYTLIVFGVLDFLLSIMGTNITFFLGYLSYITPIAFISGGGLLISKKEHIQLFTLDKFRDSSTTKGIYAGTLVFALFTLILLAGFANMSSEELDPELIGLWTNPVDEFTLQSSGDVEDSYLQYTHWQTNDNDLIFEDNEFGYIYKYKIIDDVLFIAPYEEGDSGEVVENSCSAYVKGESGRNDVNYSDKIDSVQSNGEIPGWCPVS